MIKKIFILASAVALLCSLAGLAGAQPLPKIELHPMFAGYAPKLPVWMIEPPDGSGRLFLVEQPGRVVIFPKGADGGKPREFLSIEDRKPHLTNGQPSLQEGLLCLVFHPGFKTNGLFYISYNQQNPRRSVISEMKVAADDPNRADTNTERVLLEVPQPFPTNKGGQISFGPDGYLYIAFGDGGGADDPYNNGQNTATLLGKMLRIDVNTPTSKIGTGRSQRTLHYGIPSDNPFAQEPDMGGNGARREIWAYGLRETWRYSWDRQTGELWGADVGQDLWEEVDLMVKGGNYGWCAREGTHYFKPGPEGAKYVEPVMEYPHKVELLPQSMFPNHSIGSCIIGGYVYRGKKHPGLQGVYLYGDYILGTIWGFRRENGKITQDGILLQQPKNIASFAEDADGELYVLTLDANGGDGAVFSIAAAQ
jgi:quinoprotein glucose dehydrogenase